MADWYNKEVVELTSEDDELTKTLLEKKKELKLLKKQKKLKKSKKKEKKSKKRRKEDSGSDSDSLSESEAERQRQMKRKRASSSSGSCSSPPQAKQPRRSSFTSPAGPPNMTRERTRKHVKIDMEDWNHFEIEPVDPRWQSSEGTDGYYERKRAHRPMKPIEIEKYRPRRSSDRPIEIERPNSLLKSIEVVMKHQRRSSERSIEIERPNSLLKSIEVVMKHQRRCSQRSIEYDVPQGLNRDRQMSFRPSYSRVSSERSSSRSVQSKMQYRRSPERVPKRSSPERTPSRSPPRRTPSRSPPRRTPSRSPPRRTPERRGSRRSPARRHSPGPRTPKRSLSRHRDSYRSPSRRSPGRSRRPSPHRDRHDSYSRQDYNRSEAKRGRRGDAVFVDRSQRAAAARPPPPRDLGNDYDFDFWEESGTAEDEDPEFVKRKLKEIAWRDRRYYEDVRSGRIKRPDLTKEYIEKAISRSIAIAEGKPADLLEENTRTKPSVKRRGPGRKSDNENEEISLNFAPRKISRYPKFVLPLKKLFKEMRSYTTAIEESKLPKLLSIMRKIIRRRILGLLKGTIYTKTDGIIKLYRKNYSANEDKEFIDTVLVDMDKGIFDAVVPSDTEQEVGHNKRKEKHDDELNLETYVATKKVSDDEVNEAGASVPAKSESDDDVMLVEYNDTVNLAQREDEDMKPWDIKPITTQIAQNIKKEPLEVCGDVNGNEFTEVLKNIKTEVPAGDEIGDTTVIQDMAPIVNNIKKEHPQDELMTGSEEIINNSDIKTENDPNLFNTIKSEEIVPALDISELNPAFGKYLSGEILQTANGPISDHILKTERKNITQVKKEDLIEDVLKKTRKKILIKPSTSSTITETVRKDKEPISAFAKNLSKNSEQIPSEITGVRKDLIENILKKPRKKILIKPCTSSTITETVRKDKEPISAFAKNLSDEILAMANEPLQILNETEKNTAHGTESSEQNKSKTSKVKQDDLNYKKFKSTSDNVINKTTTSAVTEIDGKSNELEIVNAKDSSIRSKHKKDKKEKKDKKDKKDKTKKSKSDKDNSAIYDSAVHDSAIHDSAIHDSEEKTKNISKLQMDSDSNKVL